MLDICAGTGSATKAAQAHGHKVIGLDIIYGDADILVDIRRFAREPYRYLPWGFKPDWVWFSPVCTGFSMAGSGSRKNGSKRWAYDGPYPFYGPRLPMDRTAREGCAIVLAGLRIIELLKPKWWWMENPMGGLMTMDFVKHLGPPVIVTYCQYASHTLAACTDKQNCHEHRMKPTCLWGVWPDTWKPRPRCMNGDPCHERAPRGAKTGTQGISGARDRARVPYALSNDIRIACEISMTMGRSQSQRADG